MKTTFAWLLMLFGLAVVIAAVVTPGYQGIQSASGGAIVGIGWSVLQARRRQLARELE